MPSPLRDPKTLSQWLELDYFRRPRQLRRLKNLTILAVLLLAIAGVLAFSFWPGNVVYQAGPVSTAHAQFNDDCAKCHTEHFRPLQRFWPGSGDLPSVTDEACLHCHDGPIHHVQQVATPSCSSCHREHRGHAQLARVPDDHCTACHADLHRKDGTDVPYQNVQRLPEGHPEFALWREANPSDPGMIRFNHQVHLKEGGVRGADGKPVVLACSACHQPDAERRYMLPINYENHCRDCHPLSVRIAEDLKDAKAQAAAEAFSNQPAPHKDPATVRATMRDRFLDFARQHQVEPVENARFVPGWRRPQPVTEKQWEWTNRQLGETERVLFDGAGGCRYCHLVAADRKPDGLPEYAPTAITSRWLKHGSFRHANHRMLACLECHADATASAKTSDVLLPKMESCARCHHPTGGARSDCVECHRYHDRGKERDLNGPLSISDSLSK